MGISKKAHMRVKMKRYYMVNKKFFVKTKTARATTRASAQNYNLHLARQRASAWQKCKFAMLEPKPDITERKYITIPVYPVHLSKVFKNKHR